MNPAVSDFLSRIHDAVTELCHAQKVSGLEIFRRKVDPVTGRSLKNPFFISSINRSRQVVYA